MTESISRVIVSSPVGAADRQFRGRAGRLLRLESAGGGWFARVRLDDVTGVEDRLANPGVPEILVHPDSLRVVGAA